MAQSRPPKPRRIDLHVAQPDGPDGPDGPRALWMAQTARSAGSLWLGRPSRLSLSLPLARHLAQTAETTIQRRSLPPSQGALHHPNPKWRQKSNQVRTSQNPPETAEKSHY